MRTDQKNSGKHPAWAVLLALSLAGIGRGQESSAKSTGDAAKDAAAEKRIAFVREKMAKYRVHAAGEDKIVYPLEENLVLRWSNPVSGVVDGGIFVWTDGRRPIVIGKCFLNERQEAWGEAIQSVAPAPFVMTLDGREVWKPTGPGIEFHPLDGAAKPAASAGGRLAQMRTLARRIEVVGIWGEKESSQWALRMLTAPVHRYQSEPDQILDGAVFAFTQGGTNPEAIALVELIQGDPGPRWQVAVARLTQYGVRASLDGKPIADFPRNERPAISEPYYRGWHWFTRYPFPKSEAAAEDEPR
jgi:hypothetical protein